MAAPVRTRIVQIVNSLAPAGAERSTVELSTALDPAEFDVSLLTVRDGPLRSMAEAAGIPVTVVGGEFDLRAPVVIARMRKELASLGPTIVHTHLIGSDVVGRLAARQAGIRLLVSTQHDLYDRGPVWSMYRHWTARWIDAQVANSEAVRAYCLEQLHVPAARVRVIENGVDPGRFAITAQHWQPGPVFGTLGTLIPVKAHETAIRALALVRESVPDARLVLAGDGPLRERLEQLAREEGIGDAVEFLGVVEATELLGRVSCLVHPSAQEAFGLAVIESMAAGRPVIASDLPAVRAILDDGAAGVLVPPGDVVELARAMGRVATDSDLAVRLSSAGLCRARERYSAARMAAEYAELYRELLDGGERP